VRNRRSSGLSGNLPALSSLRFEASGMSKTVITERQQYWLDEDDGNFKE